MTYEQLLDLLLETKDEKYAAFQKPLSNSDYEIIGIKIPILKKLAKEHYQDADLDLAKFEHHHYLEVEMLYFIFGMLRNKSIEARLDFIYRNVKYADSWMITDTPNAYLARLDYESYIDFFKKTYLDKHVYTRRIAYVIGLKVFRDNRILEILPLLRNDEEYMVTMGQAWLLASMAICYPEEIYNYLANSKNDMLRKKTISKIVDSFRIGDDYKAKFKKLRCIGKV